MAVEQAGPRDYLEVDLTYEHAAVDALFPFVGAMANKYSGISITPYDPEAFPGTLPDLEPYTGMSPRDVDSPELLGLLDDVAAEPGFDPREVQTLGADEFDLVA